MINIVTNRRKTPILMVCLMVSRTVFFTLDVRKFICPGSGLYH